MPAESEAIDKAVAGEDTRLNEIFDGIAEGIKDGIKEGVSDGLKRGLKEGIKDCISGDFDGLNFSESMHEILEDTAMTALREGAGNAVSRPVEIYMRSVCSQIAIEMTRRDMRLSESELSYLKDAVMEGEKRALKKLFKCLPDNPLLGEIAGGINTALEESLQKELAACQERLSQI